MKFRRKNVVLWKDSGGGAFINKRWLGRHQRILTKNYNRYPDSGDGGGGGGGNDGWW